MLVVTGAMLGALLQGCSADKHPSQDETNLANVAKDVTIPLEAGKMQNPLPETDEVVSQGQEVFLGSCAQCHGADGRGDTSLGRSMNPPAMDLSSAHVQHWSDAELFWIIQNGVRLTGMPAWQSSISENDTWKLARFIHNLPSLDAASASTASRVTGTSRHFHAGQVRRSKYRMASRSLSSGDTKAGRSLPSAITGISLLRSSGILR